MKLTVELIPPPECGDHMLLAKFIQAVQRGSFIDYDGFGYYATATEMYPDLEVRPSDIKDGGKIPKAFTHIVWFNR